MGIPDGGSGSIWAAAQCDATPEPNIQPSVARDENETKGVYLGPIRV